LVVVVGVMAMTACSSSDDTATDIPSSVTSESVSTTSSASNDGVTITKDIVFLEMDGHEYLVDVYVPAGEGPWPVVVAFHGGTVYKNDRFTTVIATAAAEAKMLVFAPNYVAEWPSLSAMNADFARLLVSVQRCALAFAQQEALGYGGDSGRTVVYGMSAGASNGASLVLGPHGDMAPGCITEAPPTVPIGAVFGDAEYFLHATWWDGAFDEDSEEMQAIVAETVDPAFWTADLPTRIRLWAAAQGTFPRSFDDLWGEDGWFAKRDPDGTIREDLDELGQLDDDAISYIDEGLLLATRLQQEGIDATFETFAGDHSTLPVPEIVAYLLNAAGTG